jgi:hypothetical protein
VHRLHPRRSSDNAGGNATREVQQISEDTLLLLDTYRSDGEVTIKQKLVCLYPKKLAWTSTHLTGPYKHSQFLYQITPETAKTCHLEFTAVFLDYSKENAAKNEIEELTRELRKIDADNWRLLAGIMEKELNKK